MSNTTDTSPSSSSPTEQQQQAPQPQSQPTKRSSRRANTAERRATHNAVERLRRETLNSRFLDLAAMLPALAAQRRPSKSAIVNQSIALITTQRRSRLTAARELRLIKTENDALRQELNEWRNRNSLQLVEEPPRSADLLALLALEEDGAEGEEMMLSLMNSRRAAFEIGGEDEEFGEEGEDGEGGLLSPESALPYGAAQTALTIPSIGHKVHSSSMHHHQQQQHQQQQQQAHYAAAAAAQQQAAVFEQQTAAMVRAQLAAAARSTYPQQQQQQQQQQMYGTPTATENNYFTGGGGGGGEMYGTEYAGAPWSQKAASTLATPPGTSHGHSHSQTHGHPHGNGNGNGMKSEPSPSSYANAAFLSSSPYNTNPHHHAHPHYHHQGNLGMFKPGGGGGAGGRSDDEGDSVSIGESTGSSHFSSVSDLSASLSNSMMMAGGGPCSSSPVDHTFSFNMGGMMGGMPMQPIPMSLSMGMVPMMGMGGMGGVNMGGMNMGGMSMPSPPHSVSPGGSQPQSRRPSINIPSSYGTTSSNGGGNGNGGSKHASPNPSPGPTPTQAQTQFVGMGLMM